MPRKSRSATRRPCLPEGELTQVPARLWNRLVAHQHSTFIHLLEGERLFADILAAVVPRRGREGEECEDREDRRVQFAENRTRYEYERGTTEGPTFTFREPTETDGGREHESVLLPDDGTDSPGLPADLDLEAPQETERNDEPETPPQAVETVDPETPKPKEEAELEPEGAYAIVPLIEEISVNDLYDAIEVGEVTVRPRDRLVTMQKPKPKVPERNVEAEERDEYPYQIETSRGKVCSRCGFNTHGSTDLRICPARDSLCYTCKETGHFSRVCARKREYYCNWCGGEGHYVRHCEKLEKFKKEQEARRNQLNPNK